MDLLNFIPAIYAKFSLFILVFTRIAAFFSTFILFRQDWVNKRIIISLSGLLSFYVLLYFPEAKANYSGLSITMFVQILFEFFYGFLAAFILNLTFEVFSAVGQIISMQIGLGMASLFDPKLGHITSLTHFYIMSVVLLFLLLNGHLYVIQTLIDSFHTIPPNSEILPLKIGYTVLQYSKIIFTDSILLSITIIIATLLTNLSLAIMSKFAPQFNIFSIGINLSLVIGLMCIYITFDYFINKSEGIFNNAIQLLNMAFIRA